MSKAKLETWFAGLSKADKDRAIKDATEKTRLNKETRTSLVDAGVLTDTTEEEVITFLKTRH